MRPIRSEDRRATSSRAAWRSSLGGRWRDPAAWRKINRQRRAAFLNRVQTVNYFASIKVAIKPVVIEPMTGLHNVNSGHEHFVRNEVLLGTSSPHEPTSRPGNDLVDQQPAPLLADIPVVHSF